MSSTRSSTNNINASLGIEKEKTFYEILEVEPKASLEEIQKSFRRLALIHHPDKGGNAESFNIINHAYSILSDKNKKEEYDALYGNREEVLNYQKKSFEVIVTSNSTTVSTKLDRLPPYFEEMFLTGEDRMSSKPNQLIKPLLRTIEEKEEFYWIGNPVQITDKKMQFRKIISDEEVKNAFPTSGKVKLFRLETDALEYARSLRQGDFYHKEICFEPPIAKVLIAKKVTDAKLGTIKLEYEESYKTNKYLVFARINYLETERENIIPLFARLSIYTCGPKKDYPIVPMQQQNNQLALYINEDELTSHCRLM